MRLNEEMAEVIGAFIGDGCISTYFEDERKRTVVLFTGNWKNDKDYYDQVLVASIRKKFGGMRKVYHRKDDNSIRYVLCDKRIITFFIELGMPIGEKGDRIRVPDQISEVASLTRACIRGIFNTDGSIYRRYSKKYGKQTRVYKNYAVIQFKMKSMTVIAWLKDKLEKFEINVNKITKIANCYVIRITEQKSVRRFHNEITFTHTYHKKRYLDIIGLEG